jgi:hypothetical protein
MRTARPFGVFVLLSLALPACDSKKTVGSPHDGSTPLDLGTDVNTDGVSDIVRDTAATEEARDTPGDILTVVSDVVRDATATEEVRDTSSDTLIVDFPRSDTVADAPVTGDGPDTGEAGTACVAGAACFGQTSCSSGDEVDLWCRSMLVCQSGTLQAPSRIFTTCGATAGSPCPETQPGQGTACALRSQTCSYTTGTCTCATGCEAGVDAGPCQRPKTWYCDGRPPAGCPTQAPQLGDPCPTDRAICSYGRYCYQYQVTCTAGHWEPYSWGAFGGCA